MASNAPQEIIQAPYTVFLSTGAGVYPSITAAPDASEWVELGITTRQEDGSGVTLDHTQTMAPIRVEGFTGAIKLVRTLDRAKATASTETAREEEKSTAKADAAKAGVHNLSIDKPAAGTGSGMSWDQMQKATNVNDVSADDYFKRVAAS